jgi:hypothetical protein
MQRDRPTDRFQQLHGVVTGTVFEYQLHFANIGDPGSGIAVDHQEVRLLAGGDGPNAVDFAEDRLARLSRERVGERPQERPQ